MSCGNNSGVKYGGEILWLASATVRLGMVHMQGDFDRNTGMRKQ